MNDVVSNSTSDYSQCPLPASRSARRGKSPTTEELRSKYAVSNETRAVDSLNNLRHLLTIGDLAIVQYWMRDVFPRHEYYFTGLHLEEIEKARKTCALWKGIETVHGVGANLNLGHSYFEALRRQDIIGQFYTEETIKNAEEYASVIV